MPSTRHVSPELSTTSSFRHAHALKRFYRRRLDPTGVGELRNELDVPVESEFENFVFKGPVRPSEDDLNYIMFGLEHLDGKWGGAHLFGQGRGKSEFPETWNKQIITEAIIRVQIRQFLDGNFPKPRVRYFSRVWNVIIMVGFLEDDATGQLYVSTAYPLRGVGVFQNKNGIRRNLPLRPED